MQGGGYFLKGFEGHTGMRSVEVDVRTIPVPSAVDCGVDESRSFTSPKPHFLSF
jgi:hypothetical protein